MKCFITVNPNGAAYFISDLFEGSISDVHIINVKYYNKYILVMPYFFDKGFTMQHFLLTKQTTIFIPPFLGMHLQKKKK